MLKKYLLILACLICLGAIFYDTTPPASWPQASVVQILSVFIPLFVLLTTTVELFVKNLARSFLIGLAAILLVVLWLGQVINPLLAVGILTVTVMLYRFFPARFKLAKPNNLKEVQLRNLHDPSKLSHK